MLEFERYLLFSCSSIHPLEVRMPTIIFVLIAVTCSAWAIIERVQRIAATKERDALQEEKGKPIKLRVWFSFKTTSGHDMSYQGTVYYLSDKGELMPAPVHERRLIPSPFSENTNENLLRGPYAPVVGGGVKILGEDYTFA
jgi:hypothetical protein